MKMMMLRKPRKIIQKLSYRLLNPIDKWAYGPFFDFPFGKEPRANSDKYIEIWNEAISKEYKIIDQFEYKQGYSIDKIWFHDLALITQVVIKKSDICYQHGRVLYSALSDYISRHNYDCLNIIETGTARGFSSLCMAKALHDANIPGKIVTFDILPHDIQMYWNCISDNKGPMTRSTLLLDYQSLIDRYIIYVQGDSRLQLAKIKMPRIHIAFLDGAHTYEYLLNEFSYVKDRQQTGDLVFFDDYTIDCFPGIVRAVDEICDKHNYSKEVITVSEQRGYVIAQKE